MKAVSRSSRSSSIEVDQTIVLQGRALDASGAPVDVPITWRTPDTTLIVTADGQVTGRTGGSTGRVQAQAGALASDFFSFAVRPRPDTLVLSPDSVLTVAADAGASAPLVATLRSRQPDQPLADATGGGLTLAAPTGADGTPATPVTLERVAGRTAPPLATVTVSAVTATGLPVPGSGQRFRIAFQ